MPVTRLDLLKLLRDVVCTVGTLVVVEFESSVLVDSLNNSRLIRENLVPFSDALIHTGS